MDNIPEDKKALLLALEEESVPLEEVETPWEDRLDEDEDESE